MFNPAKPTSPIRWCWSLALLCVLCACAPAQSKPATGPKPKAGAASCDGALDIVPNKAMSFTRKRRPGKPAAPHAAEAKPARKPTSNPPKQ